MLASESDSKERSLIEAAFEQEGSGESARAPSDHRCNESRHAADAEGNPRPILAEIGGYDIVRKIHEGGQGVVYEALQKTTNRRVAIKVLRHGPLANDRERARFEREARILAQIHDPRIVAIHHTGQAYGGDYFVMDLVDGVPVDTFVEQSAMSVRERLELFADIASAVEAAHLRGFIHRDLKPSNILIDTHRHPHIVDFGLAKYADDARAALAESPDITCTNQFVGSILWASPEQVRGELESVDTRSDVYSLGVVAYEMMTGQLPFRSSGDLHETVRKIADADPRPPRSLNDELDADLSAVILKCLCKDPDRRYQRASAIVDDIHSYFANQPISARPPTVFYQFQKAFRRHRLAFGTLFMFLVTILGFSVWMTALYAQANSSKAAAVRESRTNEAILSFLIHDMIAAANPEVSMGQDLTVHDQLLSAAANVASAFPDDPVVRAKVHGYIGDAFVGLGDPSNAQRHFESALSEISAEKGDDSLDALDIRLRLIALGISCGRATSLKPKALQLLEDCRRVLGPRSQRTLEAMAHLARIHWLLGELSQSLHLRQNVFTAQRELLGPEHAATVGAFVEWKLADLNTKGTHVEAEEQYRLVYDVSRKAFGDEHPHTLTALAAVGQVCALQRRLSEAEQLYAEAIAGLRRVCGDNHTLTLKTRINYAHCVLSARSQDSSAATILRDTLDTINAADEPIESLRISCAYFLGIAQTKSRQYAEAVKVHREVVAFRMRSDEQETTAAAGALGALGRAEERCGMFDSAEERYRRTYEINLKIFGPAYGDTMWAARSYVRMLSRHNDADRALAIAESLLSARREAADRPDADAYVLNCCAREYLDVYPAYLRDASLALEYAKKAYSKSGDEYHYNRYTLARAYEGVGERQMAIEMLHLALENCPLEVSSERHLYAEELARILERDGQRNAAVNVFRGTLAQRLNVDEPNVRDIGFAKYDLAMILQDRGETSEAKQLLEEFLDIADEHLDHSSHMIPSARVALAKLHIAADEYETAEPLLLSAFERCTQDAVPLPVIAQEAAIALSELYDRTGEKQLAERYRARVGEL